MSDECRGLIWALGNWEGSDLPPAVMMSCLQGQSRKVRTGWAKGPTSTVAPRYLRGTSSKRSSGCLKLRIVLNPTHPVFSYPYIPTIKSNVSVRHGKR